MLKSPRYYNQFVELVNIAAKASLRTSVVRSGNWPGSGSASPAWALHIAWGSLEARQRLMDSIAENIRSAFSV